MIYNFHMFTKKLQTHTQYLKYGDVRILLALASKT